jgi:nitric oxide reductase subunit C
MAKVAIFLSLFISYISYSFIVYTRGTEKKQAFFAMDAHHVDNGKLLFQQHNCISCHQVYGLGGYLGPDLTTAWSDKSRGEAYIKAILKSGGNRMPDFHFSDQEIDDLNQYLKYVDNTADANDRGF